MASSSDIKTLVLAGAKDADFFFRTFFAKTCKVPSAKFHLRIDQFMDDHTKQKGAFEIFRGGAKTSRVRMHVARRIAYSLNKVAIFTSKSQDHAVKSVEWMKNQIERNPVYTKTFGLVRGKKWSDVEIEIINQSQGTRHRVLAFGMTGQLRGVNIDDERPDLIIGDDPCDEENTATPAQREKTDALWFGALMKSLASPVVNPYSKALLLQTVLDEEDLISQCVRASSWYSEVVSCFDENGESTWPEMFPTAALQQDKEDHITLNKLSFWMREMESTLIASELCYFNNWNLGIYDYEPLNGICVLSIDPAPPMTDNALKKATVEKSDMALVVQKFDGRRVYLMEYSLEEDPSPEWIAMEFWRLMDKYSCVGVVVETIAFQKFLASLLNSMMRQRNRYAQMVELVDKRAKLDAIRQEFTFVAPGGEYYVRKEHTQFVSDFAKFPRIKKKDLLDAAAMGLYAVREGLISVIEEDYQDARLVAPDVDRGRETDLTWRSAP